VVKVSSVDRKIAFYNFELEKYRTNEIYFDKEFFIEFMNNIQVFNHILNIPKTNKAITLEYVRHEQVNYEEVIKLVFKSCKYNHSPDYMSSVDGSVRDSDKELHEGEKELTHLCIRVRNVEAEVILEERRSGVTINEIEKFLNQCLRMYNGQIQQPNNFKLIHGFIPSEDFLASLNSMSNVKVAEVFQHKRILGSETMDLMEREDHGMKEDIVITLKAKKGDSLMKRNLRRIYHQVIGEETEITRIRIYGSDEQNMSIKLDSDFMKRLEYVQAELLDNGIVNSNSILERMVELLGVNLEEAV
jgi:hypothetical protein